MYLVNRKLKSIYAALTAFIGIACTDCYAMENENYKNLALEFYDKLIELNKENKALSDEDFKKVTAIYMITNNELDLNNIHLSQIPKEIGNLTKLTRLTLDDNKLTQIPQNLWQLKTLTVLCLSNNRLTHLPKEIENLTNLGLLSLGNNNITHLPPEIGNIKSLKKLYLSGPNKQFIHEAFNDDFEGIKLQHFVSAQRRILSTKNALFNKYILTNYFFMEEFGFKDIGGYIFAMYCAAQGNVDILNTPAEELKYLA